MKVRRSGKLKRIMIPGLLVPGIILSVLVSLCMGRRDVGDFYAIHIYPTVSSLLSFAASPFSFSLQALIIAAFIIAFILIIVRAFRKKEGFINCLLKLATLLAWIFVWAYLGWCLNYSRSPITERVEARAAVYDSTEFRSFLSDFTEKLNSSWVKETEIDRAEVENEIKTFFGSVPGKYGLCRPKAWQHPKKMPLHRLESAMCILGYMGPFFCESHLNPDLPPVEIPNTFAHEYSHLLGVSSEAEANWWAFQCCSHSDIPGIRYSGYQCMLPAVVGNASRLLSENDFHDWTGTIRQEVKMDYKSEREFWESKRNKTLDDAQKWIYDLFLKGNNIPSGLKNYSEAVSLMMTLDFDSMKIQ